MSGLDPTPTVIVTQEQRIDATRVSISAAVKGLVILVVAIFQLYETGIGVTEMFGAAFTLELLALALIPENIYERIGRRLVGHRTLPPSDRPPSSGPPLFSFALVLALLAPSTADATGARISLTCTSTAIVLTDYPKLGGIEESARCDGSEVWFDVTSGANLVALQLTGGREVVASAGLAPSIGAVVGWKPEFWTATPMLLGGELAIAMTVISSELRENGLTHVETWLVGSLNIIGWIAVGIGVRFGISVNDAYDDFARLVMTGGLRMPL